MCRLRKRLIDGLTGGYVTVGRGRGGQQEPGVQQRRRVPVVASLRWYSRS